MDLRLKCLVTWIAMGMIPWAMAQDEDFFRKMLSGELNRDAVLVDTAKPFVEVETPLYTIDFNDDGLLETIKAQKIDGTDWIEISDRSGAVLLRRKLAPRGRDSSLYRIHSFRLSDDTRVFALCFYEGFTRYHELNGSARLYLISVDRKDLKTLSITEGPSFFVERDIHNHLYSKRFYDIAATDYNHDGIREISVKYRQISRVYFYLGKGRWKSI